MVRCKLKLSKTITGQFIPADEESIKTLSKIPVGGVIEVELIRDKVRQRRSTKQNAYYWAVVLETLVHSLNSGADKEQIHTALMIGCFGGVEVIGCIIPAKRTSQCNTQEMEEYLTWVREWASSVRKIYISMPNESGYDY